MPSPTLPDDKGLDLRDWFAGHALALVMDSYPEWQLKAWFGDRCGLTREEISSRAAYKMADAMLAERARGK
jgi:hypothetical protein